MTETTKLPTITKTPAANVRAIVAIAEKPTAEVVLQHAEKYLAEIERTSTPPNLSRFALMFGTSRAQLKEWAKEIPELDKVYTYLKTLQEAELEERGLTNRYNPNMAQFLLKAQHGYKDQAAVMVQNNLGIGGEWLTNALTELKK